VNRSETTSHISHPCFWHCLMNVRHGARAADCGRRMHIQQGVIAQCAATRARCQPSATFALLVRGKTLLLELEQSFTHGRGQLGTGGRVLSAKDRPSDSAGTCHCMAVLQLVEQLPHGIAGVIRRLMWHPLRCAPEYSCSKPPRWCPLQVVRIGR